MEDLFKKLSAFARKNRKALKPAEQWLNKFDNGNLEDAWIIAGQPFDWRKIVFIAWLASDEKIYECKLKIDGFDLRQWCGCDKNEGGDTEQKGFLFNVIFRVGRSYATPKNPSFYLIRSALSEGKKAVAEKKLKPLSTNAAIEYSLPLPMTKWADIFGVSENKLRELRKQKTYNFDQISERKWRLPKHEIPTEYLEKYRQAERPRT